MKKTAEARAARRTLRCLRSTFPPSPTGAFRRQCGGGGSADADGVGVLVEIAVAAAEGPAVLDEDPGIVNAFLDHLAVAGDRAFVARVVGDEDAGAEAGSQGERGDDSDESFHGCLQGWLEQPTCQ